MTIWDGNGLPPAAAARLQRAATSNLKTSLLSVPSAAGLDTVGLDPVGEVLGCIVQNIGFQGWGGCGSWNSPYGGYSAQVVSSRDRWSGFGPYVAALDNGYSTALSRLLAEAQALGADGVVGIRFTVKNLGNNAVEFAALGTAVRARSRTRPRFPFTTDLPGTDVAKLMLAGWAPVAVKIGIEVAVRHDDLQTRTQAGSRLFNTANVEVTGYTDLVQHTRAFARDRLHHEIGSVGADGAVVSAMTLKIWEIEPSDGHRDHVAEATITGTALAQFHRGRPAPTSSLTVLPVKTGRRGR
jgi:uncharacterized protein YbjQ (UPF0145 family)